VVGVTELLLVRHGRTEWNALGRLQGREDIPLDDVGTAQAAAAARGLARERWDAVVSSPLVRALRTAEIIAAACALAPPRTDVDLVERDYGQASGLFDHEITARWPDWVVPGRESRDQLYARAAPVLDRLVRAYPDERVIVVSHGGLIRTLVMGIESAPESSRGSIANLGTTLLRADGDRHWSVVYYNRAAG
jgi:uncharacterized phosphatase